MEDLQRRETFHLDNAAAASVQSIVPDALDRDNEIAHPRKTNVETRVSLNGAQRSIRAEPRRRKQKTGRKQVDSVIRDPKPRSSATPIRRRKRVSRNEPCPCGSGRKFKHCCIGYQ